MLIKVKGFLLLLSISIIFITASVLLMNIRSSSAQVVTPTSIVLCPNCLMPNLGDRLMNKDLTDAYLPNVSFGYGTPVNASGAIFNGAFLEGTGFSLGSTLDNVKFKNASLARSNFVNVHGINVNFKNTDLSNATFSNSILHNANFTGAKIPGTVFDSTDLTGSNMTNVIGDIISNYTDFNNTNLTNVNFTNANLAGAVNMSTANVTGAIWSNTTCPDNTNSNNNGNTCVGHF